MEIEIYIHLPDESASRPTQAIVIGGNRYKVLPATDYDPEDEEWEFVPGTVVECEEREYHGMKYLQAVRKID